MQSPKDDIYGISIDALLCNPRQSSVGSRSSNLLKALYTLRHTLRLQGSEAHDQLLGQVFGYAAIIRSGQQMDQQTAVRCAEGLTHIANRKSFLRELATNVFLELTGVVITHVLDCSAAEQTVAHQATVSWHHIVHPTVRLLVLKASELVSALVVMHNEYAPVNAAGALLPAKHCIQACGDCHDHAADQVQPDDLQFILSKDSCGVKAWLLAPITQSSPEVTTLPSPV